MVGTGFGSFGWACLVGVLILGCGRAELSEYEMVRQSEGDWFVDSPVARQFEGCWALRLPPPEKEGCEAYPSLARLDLVSEPATVSLSDLIRKFEKLEPSNPQSSAEPRPYKAKGVVWAHHGGEGAPRLGQWGPSKTGEGIAVRFRRGVLELRIAGPRIEGRYWYGSDILSCEAAVVGERCS